METGKVPGKTLLSWMLGGEQTTFVTYLCHIRIDNTALKAKVKHTNTNVTQSLSLDAQLKALSFS